jgi:hypothetical protein
VTAVQFWRQLPKKARVVLIVIAVFLLLGLIGSLSGGDKAKPQSLTPAVSGTTSTTTVTTTTTTTPTPPPTTVRDVIDGRTLVLSDGKQVVVQGLAQPGECWAADSLDFAKRTLLSQPIELVDATAQAATVMLASGENYATLALGKGLARAEATAARTLLQGQEAAQRAALGFWSEPCKGLDVKPAPQPRPVVPQPQPQPQPEPAPAPPPSAYYANCSAAKAAGAAPLYRGQPGYRAALDRDGDGVACE